MSKREKIKTLSLFSGAGGLDIGFHSADFEIVACVEIEPAYAKTLTANIGKSEFFGSSTVVHCQDIKQFDPSQYLHIGIECVIGGPPCQTFSAAGRRSGGVLGTIDARGRLFESYCRILKVIKPKVFVFENVYGLPGANGGGPWREICDAFRKLGYSLEAEVVDAADYGVPQHRERLIIVGYRGGHEAMPAFRFPMPTHGPDAASTTPLMSVSDAISDLQDPNELYHEFDGLYGHLLSLVPEGLNYSFFTREMGYPQPYFAWRSKFHDFLYKVDRTAPCRTIKAQPGKFTGPFHWKNRHFNVTELKRLQSFPDAYNLVGAYGKVVEQIGNSVPPRLGYVIAESVREQLLRPSIRKKFKLRPASFKSTFRLRQRERTVLFKQIAEREIGLRFSNVALLPQMPVNKTGSYFVSYEGLFTKLRTDRMSENLFGKSSYSVSETRCGSRISLEVEHVSSKAARPRCVEITINGLKKYLLSIDELHCSAHIARPEDMFFLWDIIEEVLTTSSQFYTLIDIYGHYANRGDTVRVATTFNSKRKSQIERALEFFGNSANCGMFVDVESWCRALSIGEDSLSNLVDTMRSQRWDVRSARTHSTITGKALLCTYPFPLLSGKAQLERRVNES